MTEFATNLRRRCRNPKCRLKLPEPVSNEREAFCCRGCYRSFYRHRCLICEQPMERKTERQREARSIAAREEGIMNVHVPLRWPVLKASRLLEFCSQKELVLQTGHSVDQWPLVLVKVLFDNALDAAEEAGTAPARWYDPERFERLIAAYVADDQDRQRTRTVREFVAEFRGMSGTAKQKQVLDETSTARMALAELFADGKADKVKIANLLSAIQRSTKSVKPQEHGVIAKEHLPTRFAAAGADPTFNYKRLVRDDAGLPTVIEIVFAYCPDAMATRRLITGVNWSVGINNPFRQLGDNGESLDTYLEMQRVGRSEPVILLVHLASPRIAYTDREKAHWPRWRNRQCRQPGG